MVDQIARDRIKEDLNATLFVEAGAGTGKTTALVGRIVALVSSGVPVEHVAAITFTDRAASELRDQVRRRFEQMVSQDSGTAGLAAAALVELDGAALCTLHAFAQRILIDHPIEAGLPPAVELMDDVSGLLEFDERWSLTLHDLLNDPDQTFTVLAGMELGITLDHLRKLALRFDENWDLVEQRLPSAPKPTPLEVDQIIEALQHLTALADHCATSGDKMAEKLSAIAEFTEELARNTADPLSVVRLLSKSPTVTGKGAGNKGNWTGDVSVGEVREQLVATHETITDELQRLTNEIIARLIQTIGRSAVAAAGQRQRQGQLSFHDLLVLARRVLLHPDHGLTVRKSLSQRYQRLLLDEFQDTDPLQIELAALIADPDTITTDWRQLKPRPGALFFVGDPKQSIYGFRRADISLYLSAQESFDSEGINLERNFRTTGPVIDWVNNIFSQLITPQAHAQPNYVPLVAQREGSLVGPSVTFLGFDGHEKINADQRRTEDATEVAATITTALAEGWTILDQETDQWRPCRPGDIAILVRTRKPVADLAKALEAAGVPCRVEAGSDPWKNDEVRDLLTTLRAIDDPTDELALVTALRSPLFGCSDDDLYAFVSHGGSWNHQDPGTVNLPDDHPVRDGLAWMKELHNVRPWSNAIELLDRVIRERKAMELAMAYPRPRDAWRRIRTFSDTTRTYCELRSGDLRSFLHWCSLHAHDEVKVDEVVPPEADDDAVRIMTIHASKGLEFPICVLADLGSTRNTRSLHVSFPTGTSGIAVGFKKDLVNDERQHSQDQSDHHEHLERLRLLYVAATRARDHLVVSLHRKLSKKPAENQVSVCSAEIICEASDPSTVTLATPIAQPFVAPPAPLTSTLPDHTRWQDDLTKVQEHSNLRPTVAATSLTPESTEEDAHTAYGEAGRHGPAAGRAVHKALEIIDFSSDGQAEARQAAAAEDTDQKLVASMVSAALRSPSVTAAAQSDHWRELYVAASVDPGLLLEGYIDLAYRDGDGLVIVDYKTDGYQTSEDLDAKVAHYRLQGAAYALMAQEATGLTVKRMVFCFLGNGPAQERSIDNLPTAIKEARAQAIATR